MLYIKGEMTIGPFPIALIVSRFNQSVTELLYQGAMERLRQLQFGDDLITVVEVPGAVEIPIVARQLLRYQSPLAIVALGAVIRGETSHYDYVCHQASHGCQQVALQHDIPVIFGVLTTENEAQARDRVGGAHGHKGVEAIDTAVEIVSVLQQLTD
jgi:6,7-dimethyl-8-ribityllumazine synthase